MALIVWLFLAYAVGLWVGFGGFFVLAGVAIAALGLQAALGRAARPALAACTFALGMLVARDAVATDRACTRAAIASGRLRVALLTPLRAGQGASARAVSCGTRLRLSAARATSLPTGTVVDVDGAFRRSGGGLAVRRATVTKVGDPRAIDRWRARVSATMDRRFGDDAPLARALVLAEQYDLPADLRTRYADAGIIHMVSVSGLHVSIIAGGLLAAFAAAGLPARTAQGAAIAVLAAYVVFIGAPPPAVRSAAMLSLTHTARWLQRPTCTWAIWAVGSGVSLVEPRIAVDLGWQLSVGGMAGLIASGGLSERWFGKLSGWRQPIVEGIVATGVATIVSAPIVAWTFGRISVAAVLTNLAAGPLFNVAQPLLFATVLLEWIEPIAAFLGDATRGALALIGLVARVGAAIPFGVVAVAPNLATGVAITVAATATVVACVVRRWQRPAALALGALGLAAWWPLLPGVHRGLEIHVIDVGQGDAIAVRSPRGRWLLVDGGGSWASGDAGTATVAPYLRRRGGDVVYLVMTHPHADHVGGVRSLVAAAGVDTLWDSGYRGTSSAYREALDAALAARVAWRRVGAGDSLTFDGAMIRVLAPDSAWTAQQDNPNEASLVLRVDYGDVRVLLTGDAETGEEGWMVDRYRNGELEADVLKLGHHGSSTSSTAAFLDRVRPRVALVSVGADNDYGHPSPSVLQDLDARGVYLLRTDDDGNIVLRTDGTAIDLTTQDGRWHSLPALRRH